MFSDYTYPSLSVPAPIITFIPATRYDEKGRQLGFTESTVQVQERKAFQCTLKDIRLGLTPPGSPSPFTFSDASTVSTSNRSRSSSPTYSPGSDVIDISASPEPFLIYSTPLPECASKSARLSPSLLSPPSPHSSSHLPSLASSPFANTKRHRRQPSFSSLSGAPLFPILHAIPEED